MKLHVLRQIAPYPNNSLAQSPSKLIRSHAGDWIGGRHLSYSPRIGLPNADHPIIQSAETSNNIQKGLAFGCERSGTATVRGVSSSSGSCPAGSRSYGRSHRPRQHEAFDCHAFKRNRQEECVQMPVKIARSAPRPSFGLPELLVAIHTSHQSCYKAGKARIFSPVRESSEESRLSCVNMGSGRGHKTQRGAPLSPGGANMMYVHALMGAESTT